ncbi:MAG: NnrS family protein [Candidatus Acidiferrales bacterium]
MKTITGATSVAEILKRYPRARQIFDQHGLQGCGGREGPAESLDFFARVHQIGLDELLRELNAAATVSSATPYQYQETLADYIYRRFFKAGIAIVLSVGGLWGVINLFQIEFAKSLLLPQLLSAIHAHAHAMVFGWVGLFVMGFAYQSFPRFKHTTLWQPELANLSFFLMLFGIAARVAAEMLQPRHSALAFGLLSATAELAAIGILLLVIFQTARGSVQPRGPYEKFIFAALLWFLIQAVFSEVFFMATATATTETELVQRIALLDAPLRDMQFLGFAAMMIAGVSLRFIPVVYGLAAPARDRRNLIFVLMNMSLLLEVGMYLGLFLTGNPAYAIGLELSYLLIFSWAGLLVSQLTAC